MLPCGIFSAPASAAVALVAGLVGVLVGILVGVLILVLVGVLVAVLILILVGLVAVVFHEETSFSGCPVRAWSYCGRSGGKYASKLLKK